VLVVIRGHAPAGEIDHLDIQLQRYAIDELSSIPVAAGAGK